MRRSGSGAVGRVRQALMGCLIGGLLTACGADPAPSSAAGALAPAPARTESATAATIASIEPVAMVLEQSVAYGESSDRNLTGFLVMPADALEPPPGILLIHERWGLSDVPRALARRLAGEGFVVLAVDLFAGDLPADAASARQAMATANSTPEAILSNLQSARDFLTRYALAPAVGVLGFGFGGNWAWQMAVSLPEDLDAAVVFYGQYGGEPEAPGQLTLPVLGLYGARDANLPAAQGWEAATAAGTGQLMLQVYPDVGPGFASAADPATYNHTAAVDAWAKVVDFFGQHLR